MGNQASATQRLTEARIALARRRASVTPDPGPQGEPGPQGPPGLAQLVLQPATGAWVSPAADASGLATQAQVANRTIIAPFVPSRALTIDQVAISIGTGVAGSLAKIVIFAADTAGRPAAVLAETGTIDCATAVTRTISLAAPLALQAGQVYWVGIRSSAAQTLRCLPLAATPSLGFTTAATPANLVTLIRTEAFATPAPAWAYAEAQKSTALAPLVLLRAA